MNSSKFEQSANPYQPYYISSFSCAGSGVFAASSVFGREELSRWPSGEGPYCEQIQCHSRCEVSWCNGPTLGLRFPRTACIRCSCRVW